MNHKYKGFFHDWEIGVATKIVREFIRNWKFLTTEDEKDLLQKCLIQWFLNRQKYDPDARASQKTFMARIVRNKLMDLVREQDADKRKVAHNSDSLNQPLTSDEDSFPRRSDKFPTLHLDKRDLSFAEEYIYPA